MAAINAIMVRSVTNAGNGFALGEMNARIYPKKRTKPCELKVARIFCNRGDGK